MTYMQPEFGVVIDGDDTSSRFSKRMKISSFVLLWTIQPVFDVAFYS